MTRYLSTALFVLAASSAALSNCATARAADPNGTWQWSFERPQGAVEVKLDLKAAGEKLTGKVYSNDRETEITDGKFKNDEVSFTVIRERDGNKFVMTYKGKVTGDEINGMVEFEIGDRSESRPWEAARVVKKK